MDIYSNDTERTINANTQEISDINLQKPDVYNQYSPFHEIIRQHSFALFDEIRENLSRTIQQDELEPGFSIWSKKLKQFISTYGFNFTKDNHLKLINFYLSILSITNLNFIHVQTCFDMLYELLRKTRLITREDLTIDWRILYDWAKIIHNNHDKTHSLVVLPKNIDISVLLCLVRCSAYFSAVATQEILDELRPQMCPIDWSFIDTMKMFEFFLPVILPSNLHNQGFQLWLTEFFTIWENIYNSPVWDMRLVDIFSLLAWHNIGYINWEPWLPQIFTRILRSFSLPIGKMQMSSQKYSYSTSYLAKWIVAMIGNGSLCLQYLRDLLLSIKSFYHPSNTGKFQENLVKFVLGLAENFVNRVHLERKKYPVWHFTPIESHRLTEQDITDFVNCVKEYAFISIFNKSYADKACEACQYLSILRPELIVPLIVESHFSSITSMTEPHRFTSVMKCLKHITRQIVQQTPSYSQGQTYVLPLLLSVLPGIDLNDLTKTLVTLEFLDIMFVLITCVDCSSAVDIRNDLTDIEKKVCLSTAEFGNFIDEFFNRIFRMIDILSADMSDAVPTDTDVNVIDDDIKLKLTSIIFNIVQQCSNKIFQTIQEKMLKFVTGACLSPKVRDIVAYLILAFIRGNPIEGLKYFLPKTCESIEKILNNYELSELSTNSKEDIELTWYLFLFVELVHTHGNTLLIYKEQIISVFRRCIPVINKNTYDVVSDAARNLLESLTHIYPIDYRLTTENLDESFVNFLPIRAWGQGISFDKLQVQFHIPNDDEINFASEFIETFMYPELTLLNDKCFTMSNNERLRSLTLVQSMAFGCFRLVPGIESKQMQKLTSSIVSCYSKYQNQDLIHSKKLKLKENLRRRLFIDIGNLLDKLIQNHSDDVLSIKATLRFYSMISIYYGQFILFYSSYKHLNTREKLIRNKLCDEGKYIRSLAIGRMGLQIKDIQLNNIEAFTDIDQQIVLKLFDLSINRYSAVRRKAQIEMFDIFNCHRFSFEVIVDRIVETLNTPGEPDHDQIKGCLHILLGNSSFFLPGKYSWKMKEKLWPSIVRTAHAKKLSTKNLIEDIKKKIYKDFLTEIIIQNTNQISKHAAIMIWRPLESNEIETHEEYNQINVQSYTNLMETLSSLVQDDTLTWGQQAFAMSLLCLLLQKQVSIPSSCIKVFLDYLIHDNIELRKSATKGIAALCRLQKPSRIYEEKSLEEIFDSMGKPLPILTNDDEYQPGDRDDNLWLTIDDYKPPKTQTEWEHTCFLDKPFHGYYTWPKKIKYSINKRERYTQNNMIENVKILYDHFIDKNFVVRAIQLMILGEEKNKDEKTFDKVEFAMFKGLFRNFGLLFIDNFMEQLDVLVHDERKEKQEGSHRVAAEIVAGMIRGSKYWTLEMINELWEKLTPFLTDVCSNLSSETLYYWNACFLYSMENEDPRRMYRVIGFILTLIDSKTTSNTFNEISRWSLIRNLMQFHWRIPSIWHQINEHVRTLFDHPSSGLREHIANLLAVSLSFDIILFNGKSTRQPNTNKFIDDICKQLHEAIEIYEKTPLINITDQNVEIVPEARKALNFIETVIRMHTQYFARCRQPIKDAIIRIFPYLCEMQSIAAIDNVFKNNLAASRLTVGMSYLNTHFLETLIQQLTKVCRSSKWNARKAALEFTQNMIFCNLFNVRPYAQQLYELVLECLFDEQLEVRIAASTILSGFYQCGYIQVTSEDMTRFRQMSETNYFTKIDGKKVILPTNIIKRHAGILGLCAIVLSSPYDIPSYVPDALMLLCEHSHDPDLIQKSIKTCLSEFRRTHHDSWHEHRGQFNEDQLVVLADVLISHSYYA